MDQSCGPRGADPGDGWTPAQASQVFIGASLQVPRDRPSDLRHFLAQVDEEAALEQAVKFCQVHLGAAAQRQVSLTQRAPCRGPRAVGKRVGIPQIGTVPVVSGAEERWGVEATEPHVHKEPLTTSLGGAPSYGGWSLGRPRPQFCVCDWRGPLTSATFSVNGRLTSTGKVTLFGTEKEEVMLQPD